MGTTTYHGLDGFDAEGTGELEYLAPRSPVHARFLATAIDLVATDAEVRAAVLEAWEGRVFHARYERPLLLCVAARFDALRDPSHPLRAALGSEPPDPSPITPDAVRAALLRDTARASLRTRFVQTNEVTRAIAWRWPLGLVARGRASAIVDLGCSAGLNLVADRIAMEWSDAATGAPIAFAAEHPSVARVGLDRAPIDVRDPDARDWLRASIWPGQTERLARFDAAADAMAAARTRGEVRLEASDAAAMPARVDALTRSLAKDVVVLAYQTVMRDYVLPEVVGAYDAAMRDWLLAHAGRAVWTELERAPSCAPGPAELRVHFARPEGGRMFVRTVVLGSGEFHPTALQTNAAAVHELATAAVLTS